MTADRDGLVAEVRELRLVAARLAVTTEGMARAIEDGARRDERAQADRDAMRADIAALKTDVRVLETQAAERRTAAGEVKEATQQQEAGWLSRWGALMGLGGITIGPMLGALISWLLAKLGGGD